MDQPIVTVSPHQVFIWENDFKPTSHPVKILDTLFPVYKKNNGGRRNTPSLISTEELMECSNEKDIYTGMGDTFYTNFVLFTMDEFKCHLYLYYFNGL